jgi:hypothetical protein
MPSRLACGAVPLPKFEARMKDEGLHSRRVSLRPVVPADLPFLYRIEVLDGSTESWRTRGATPNPIAYLRSVFDGFRTAMVCATRSDGRPFGLIAAYNAAPLTRRLWIAMTVERGSRRSGATIEAAALFIDYCFTVYRVEQVFVEATQERFAQFASFTDFIGRSHGSYRSHDAHCGSFSDRAVTSVDRVEWLDIARPWVERMRGGRIPTR